MQDYFAKYVDLDRWIIPVSNTYKAYYAVSVQPLSILIKPSHSGG